MNRHTTSSLDGTDKARRMAGHCRQQTNPDPQEKEAAMPDNCQWCGQFLPAPQRRGRPRLFCSERCKQRYRSSGGVHPTQRTCSECPARLPKESRPDRMTCSLACRSVRYRRLQREQKEQS